MDLTQIFALFGALGYLMISVAFLAGLCLVGLAFWMKYGKMGSNGGNNPNSSFWTFVAGMLLLCSPALYFMTMNTFTEGWDTSREVYVIDQASITAMSEENNAMLAFLPKNSVIVLTMFVYSFGLYAYLKGLYLFRFAGTMGQDGRTQAGRAWGHTIGGIFVLNIQWLSCALLTFFIALSYC